MTATALTPLPGLRWWREVTYVVAFYGMYSLIRNQFGSGSVPAEVAFDNARRVIELQQAVGLYVEGAVQGAFLDWPWLVRLSNLFYGTLHFAVTGGALLWLFVRHPARYGRWRTTLGAATALALVGFALFPLMPPRLLPTLDASFPFVDTLVVHGGLWSFDSGTIKALSNQYAAMPSLHFGWALWSSLALAPAARTRVAAVGLAAYPAATLLTIVVTGNHYLLDAIGGAVVVGMGYVVAVAWEARRPRPAGGALTAPTAGSAALPGELVPSGPAGDLRTESWPEPAPAGQLAGQEAQPALQ